MSADLDACKQCERTSKLKKCTGCQAVCYCSTDCQSLDWILHKSECTALKSGTQLSALPPRKPLVLLVGLDNIDQFDEMYESMMLELQKHSVDKKIINADKAISWISVASPKTVKAILLIDGEFYNVGKRAATRALKPAISKYVTERGGTVIAGYLYPNYHTNLLKPFFSEYFELPWDYTEYCRTTFVPNTESELGKDSRLKPSSMKAVQLNNVSREDAVMIVPAGARVESRVFAPDLIKQTSATPCAFKKVGNGYVGFLGDVNAEAMSTTLTLVMCGF